MESTSAKSGIYSYRTYGRERTEPAGSKGLWTAGQWWALFTAGGILREAGHGDEVGCGPLIGRRSCHHSKQIRQDVHRGCGCGTTHQSVVYHRKRVWRLFRSAEPDG